MTDAKVPPGRHARFRAEATAVHEAADALEAFCTAEHLPSEAVWPLQVALDEIVANIVHHGPGDAESAGFDVWFSRTGDLVEIVVADDGPAFDPLARADPDVGLPLDARQPGGLGIMLVKSLMDDVRYERRDRNILTLRKRVRRGGADSDEDPAKRT